MKKLSLLVLSFLILAPASYAASTGNTAEPPQDKLKELVKTLESETARQDLIDNIKALIEVKEERKEDEAKSSPLDALGQAVNLDTTASEFGQAYRDFLRRNNLSSDFAGKSITTLICIGIAGLLFAGIRKLSLMMFAGLERLRKRYNLRHHRYELYARIIRIIGYVFATLGLIYTLLALWGWQPLSFVSDQNLLFLTGMLLNLVIISVIAIGLWEVANSIVEYALHKADKTGGARSRTLMPIVQNILFMVIATLFSLVALSEIGVDIVPLLAGAGVVGVALGFGAQTMVKDFLTGFAIILEDIIQVGDVIRVGGASGLVEKLTLRKIQLRDQAGIVYTIPFSEITVIENMTKDFSYYVMDIPVAYREETDEVSGYLREIDEAMRKEEPYKDMMLAPIEILGVDKFSDRAVIIKARLKTRPIRQWEVGREFNRRMKKKFDEMGVEIPFPHQTIYFGEDKKGKAPPARILTVNENK